MLLPRCLIYLMISEMRAVSKSRHSVAVSYASNCFGL